MKKTSPGFTYIELIVVIAIFSVITVIISISFILFTKAQTSTSVRENLIADGRVLIERIARQIRSGSIQFDAYTTPIPQPISFLAMKDPQDNTVYFELLDGECDNGQQKCLFMQIGESDSILNDDDLIINYLDFYIHPIANPFEQDGSGGYLSNIQPHVTIVMGISALQKGSSEPISIQLQTSVSSKRYVR